ncbi:hypothetical protein G7017_03660 [Pseudomonas fulva]|uniref:hypothetical protein n=1 Tax=Pseudomonas fulva TaxID=47880 RepID=UPI0015E39E59|nr:hypothetical protein [Pseudomonas fulva]MBA1219999.1 hypothetical protein [Pseudomonas fulva]
MVSHQQINGLAPSKCAALNGFFGAKKADHLRSAFSDLVPRGRLELSLKVDETPVALDLRGFQGALLPKITSKKTFSSALSGLRDIYLQIGLLAILERGGYGSRSACVAGPFDQKSLLKMSQCKRKTW